VPFTLVHAGKYTTDNTIIQPGEKQTVQNALRGGVGVSSTMQMTASINRECSLDGSNELKQILWRERCRDFEHANHSTPWTLTFCIHHL